MRVVVALEPRSYREVIAHAIALARPRLQTTVLPQTALDEAVRRLSPDAVICSAVTPAVRAVRAWIELYPGDQPLARTCVDGERGTVPDPDLRALLTVLDGLDGPAAAAI
jgi:hypothetical protein